MWTCMSTSPVRPAVRKAGLDTGLLSMTMTIWFQDHKIARIAKVSNAIEQLEQHCSILYLKRSQIEGDSIIASPTLLLVGS